MNTAELNKYDAERICRYFGLDNQEEKLIEEMAELTQAIIKDRQCHTNKTEENYCEEMADVAFMLIQIVYEKGYDDDDLQYWIREKADRTIERIMKGYYD